MGNSDIPLAGSPARPKVNFFKADCEDLNKMQEITKNIDVVIHAAAYAHEGLSVVSPNVICSISFVIDNNMSLETPICSK